MLTTMTVTFDQVFELATKLPPADKLRLIERLAPQVLDAVQPQSSSSLIDLAGSWAGDDLEERLAEVYASRSPVEE